MVANGVELVKTNYVEYTLKNKSWFWTNTKKKKKKKKKKYLSLVLLKSYEIRKLLNVYYIAKISD